MKNLKGFEFDGKFYPFIAGGDGTGEGSGDGEGNDKKGSGDSEKKESLFTQEQVNQMMASHKKGLQAAAVSNDKKIAELTSQLSDMKDLISKYAPKDPELKNPDDDPDAKLTDIELADKRLEYERKKNKAALEASEKKALEITKKLEETEQRRLSAEKDRFLDEALVKARCLDNKMGKRMFREQMEYDPESNEWYFMSLEGVRMTPEEGIENDLPDYLRRAQSKTGSGGKSPKAVLESALTKQKDEVQDLKSRAQKSGNDTDLARLLQGERKLRQLESELAVK